MKPNPAIVTVSFRPIRGEPVYFADIKVSGRRALCVTDAPSLQYACLEVLAWSERQGKELVWNYENCSH
jgi:hypothetical protein